MALLDQAAHRLLAHVRLRVSRAATNVDQGAHRSNVRAAGSEFAGHREYVPGDDARRIDWTAFARNKSLSIRTFESERDVRVYVLVDVSPSMTLGNPPKIDVARRIAAACGMVGLNHSDRVQLIPFSDTLGQAAPMVRKRDEYPALDRFLASLETRGTTTFAEVTRTFSERFPVRGLVVVVSDLMECADWAASVRRLAMHGHQPCLIHTASTEDHAPTLGGELELTDSETGEIVRVTADRTLLEAYRAEVAEHVERTRAACRAAGGRFVQAPIDMPFEGILRDVLAPALEGP